MLLAINGATTMKATLPEDIAAASAAGFKALEVWAAKRIPSMAGQARRGLVFFNNHVRAQAPANARQLAILLAAQGMAEKGP